MAEKHVFDDASLYKLLFHSQICSTGQLMVFSYPMVSPKVLTTLMTPYSYPIDDHSDSFESHNRRKRVKNKFLMMHKSTTSYLAMVTHRVTI